MKAQKTYNLYLESMSLWEADDWDNGVFVSRVIVAATSEEEARKVIGSPIKTTKRTAMKFFDGTTGYLEPKKYAASFFQCIGTITWHKPAVFKLTNIDFRKIKPLRP